MSVNYAFTEIPASAKVRISPQLLKIGIGKVQRANATVFVRCEIFTAQVSDPVMQKIWLFQGKPVHRHP